MNNVENELQGKRILVTGANGFIGSRLVEKLLECNANVLALVDKGAYLDRIQHLIANPKLSLKRCSLNDLESLSEQIRGWGKIDIAAHLGLHVPNSQDFIKQSVEEINMNLLPAINLMTALGDSLQGICFSSSTSVYGTPSSLPVKETDVPAPLFAYGAAKLAVENFLQVYGETHKIPVTVLRFATVYGPGETKHRAIPNFLNRIAQGQPPVIYGDGSETRDYIYIDDVVQATIRALAIRPDKIFNIGSGRGYTALEIAQKILALYPTEIKPQFLSRNGQHNDFVCDNSAAKEILHFVPQTDLEDGLAREIKWHKEFAETACSKNAVVPAADTKHEPAADNHSNISFLKSAIDRTTALLGLVCSSPLMAIIAVGIKLDSHGSPIFAQKRVGMNGREFVIYKFRTMYSDNDDSKYKAYLRKYVLENAPYRIDHNGQAIYKVDDYHAPVTKFGALLRKTNLDELPQLLNILKGDMSLVGPRPDVPFAVRMYNDWHRERLQAKPGLTGLWQVCRRKNLSFEDMVRLDINYINKQSLFLDTKILFKTIGIIFGKNGS